MRLSFSCALLLLVSLDAVISVVGRGDAQDEHIRELLAWLRENNGYFNSKLEIRREDPKDPASEFGVFAKKPIELKETLMEIPANLMLRATDDEDEQFEIPDGTELQYFEKDRFEGLCDLTRTLIVEMRLEDDSDFAPYVHYLLEKEEENIPALWSEPAKKILHLVTFGPRPPNGAFEWVEDFEETGCIHDDEFEMGALSFISSRGWRSTNDTVLVPVFDIINHSNNDKLRNTETTHAIEEGFPVHVRALKEIEAGEQLFISYDDCLGCKEYKDLIIQTPEIFRDYGFVESYPQRWDFGGVTIRVEEVKGVDGKITLEAIHLAWEPTPNDEWLEYFKVQMGRLQDMLDDAELLAARDSIPPKEWETLFLYHSAMMKALSSAVKKSSTATDDGEYTCLAEDSCSAVTTWLRYSDFDKQLLPTDLDMHYDEIYQCETLAMMNAIDAVEELLDDHEIVKSHYQYISYGSDPKNDDMCFYLDGTWQICTSYRPQYHEMGVHDTIRYLTNEPKRVLWVGGGDAMFLQEILKYPSLELAVGLELDQKVVRGAFKYFGTQPHWDNEKVQWWFGDASKSLLMLPEDYFGSFDVVLVDLSDTLLSLSVTKEMDIIGALSLLLRPGGVFAMNELVCFVLLLLVMNTE
jgi:spermidine synthase